MDRRRHLLGVVVLAALAGGCASTDGDRTAGTPPDRLHRQAAEALARYDQAVRDTGGTVPFVPIGEFTAQVGEWEPANEDNKLTLGAGRIAAAGPLPARSAADGVVVWANGAHRTVPLISAGQALDDIAADATGDCDGCVPLKATGARLTSIRIETSRGPATAPAWAYTLRGTAVQVTRIAVAASTVVKVTPPSWDPDNAPGGLAIDSATGTITGKRLTVAFTGAPAPRSRPCGADYAAEAVESATAVVVIVVEHRHAAGETCPAIGGSRTATVDLAEPLGERAVLEVQQGLPVPLTIMK